ncbi:MAG: peptide chain release factor 1 [bacterium]|nr:peptide chain release factor 1 [bacterium]
MREMLDAKLDRFEELEKMLVDPEVLSVSSQAAAVAREHGSLAKLATRYRRFLGVAGELNELAEMAKSEDVEAREMAEEEIVVLRKEREEIWSELLDMTVGGEDASRTRCIMEIRAGTGGDEAALFARDLYEMYRKHCENRGWKFEILEASPTELGGFKEISCTIEGEGAFLELQYESGGHRVQRVPETETKGRLQTSMATVAIMAEPEDVEVTIRPEDYEKETFRASGPGGQHVNKTDSAVRVRHKETGLVVSMQDESSQHKNLAKALRVLKVRLYELYQTQKDKERADERSKLIGSGDRSQRVRTFNFPENRVSDHRINLSIYHLDQILAGDIQPFTDALIDHDRQALRSTMGALDE